MSNDAYVRTTSAKHKAAAQVLWQKAAAKGEIYLHYYKGWYNARARVTTLGERATLPLPLTLALPRTLPRSLPTLTRYNVRVGVEP